jgi:large subunit ribosomal protein L27
MAHTKAGGSTQNLRDSQSKRLGVKKFAGQPVKPGNIIVRQRGSKFRASDGVRVGKDDTLYADTTGVVAFFKRKIKKFNGQLQEARYVKVVPVAK